MHYCLSTQVDKEYLKKADEIRIKYKNIDSILDLYELNPTATIILTVTEDQIIDWDIIERYNKMLQERLVIETNNFKIMEAAKLLKIKFFYAIPVNNFYDFKALVDYGCCDVKIDAPLTHMLDKIEKFDITIRMTPNIAYYAYIPRENGVIGSWVRPEDTELYEEYVDVFEFEDCDKKKEQALYRIYAEQKNWPGMLNNLITNLNYDTTNRLILPEFGKVRMFCKQRCVSGTECSLCYRMLNMANPDKIEKLKAKIEKENNNENLNT